MDRGMDKGSWAVSTWSLALGRDVLASLLATGLATFAFTIPAYREPPVPDHAFGPTGKLVERLGQEGTEPIHRALRVYETIALLRQAPTPEPAAFSVIAAEPPARVAAHGRSEEPPVRMAVAVLPPERPKAALRPQAVDLADAALPGPQPIRLLGWAVPGSEHLPSRDEAIGRLASLGGTVGNLGARIVDGVHLP